MGFSVTYSAWHRGDIEWTFVENRENEIFHLEIFMLKYLPGKNILASLLIETTERGERARQGFLMCLATPERLGISDFIWTSF